MTIEKAIEIDWINEITDLVVKGETALAVRNYRELTGLSLKTSYHSIIEIQNWINVFWVNLNIIGE